MWQRWEIACTRVMTMQACWSEKNVILLFESGGSQITSKTRKVWEFQASVRILGYTRRNVGIWKKCSLFFLELRFPRLGLRWYICISLFIYTSLGIFPHIPTLISHSIPFIPIYPSLSHTQDFFSRHRPRREPPRHWWWHDLMIRTWATWGDEILGSC